jgi:hypothetical protein
VPEEYNATQVARGGCSPMNTPSLKSMAFIKTAIKRSREVVHSKVLAIKNPIEAGWKLNQGEIKPLNFK